MDDQSENLFQKFAEIVERQLEILSTPSIGGGELVDVQQYAYVRSTGTLEENLQVQAEQLYGFIEDDSLKGELIRYYLEGEVAVLRKDYADFCRFTYLQIEVLLNACFSRPNWKRLVTELSELACYAYNQGSRSNVSLKLRDSVVQVTREVRGENMTTALSRQYMRTKFEWLWACTGARDVFNLDKVQSESEVARGDDYSLYELRESGKQVSLKRDYVRGQKSAIGKHFGWAHVYDKSFNSTANYHIAQISFLDIKRAQYSTRMFMPQIKGQSREDLDWFQTIETFRVMRSHGYVDLNPLQKTLYQKAHQEAFPWVSVINKSRVVLQAMINHEFVQRSLLQAHEVEYTESDLQEAINRYHRLA